MKYPYIKDTQLTGELLIEGTNTPYSLVNKATMIHSLHCHPIYTKPQDKITRSAGDIFYRSTILNLFCSNTLQIKFIKDLSAKI